MTVSQTINEVDPQSKAYDDDITVTDVPKGQFLAVIMNSINPGESTRAITVQLMDLEVAPGGTNTINSALYVRQDGETSVKVTIQDNSGSEIATNTSDYPT